MVLINGFAPKKCLEKLSNWGDIAEKVRVVANESDDMDLEDIDTDTQRQAENVWKEGW